MEGPIDEKVDLNFFCRGLTRDESGIWRAGGVREISGHSERSDNTVEMEDESFWYRHRNAILITLLNRFPPRGILFDIGAGTGFVAQGLRRAGFESVILEPSERGVEHAFRKGLSPIIHGGIFDVSFKDETVPAFGMFDVLEHVEQEAALLRRLWFALRPQGCLYLAVPAYSFLWSQNDVDAGHVRRYTLRGLMKAVQKVGFTPIYGTYYFRPLVLPILLLRAFRLRTASRYESRITLERRQHRLGRMGQRLMDGLLRPEVRKISSGRSMPMGSSCLLVAEKP